MTRSHLLHLVELIDSGAIVLPASSGFYGIGPNAKAQQLIDFVAGKALDAIGVKPDLLTRLDRPLTLVTLPVGRQGLPVKRGLHSLQG